MTENGDCLLCSNINPSSGFDTSACLCQPYANVQEIDDVNYDGACACVENYSLTTSLTCFPEADIAEQLTITGNEGHVTCGENAELTKFGLCECSIGYEEHIDGDKCVECSLVHGPTIFHTIYNIDICHPYALVDDNHRCQCRSNYVEYCGPDGNTCMRCDDISGETADISTCSCAIGESIDFYGVCGVWNYTETCEDTLYTTASWTTVADNANTTTMSTFTAPSNEEFSEDPYVSTTDLNQYTTVGSENEGLINITVGMVWPTTSSANREETTAAFTTPHFDEETSDSSMISTTEPADNVMEYTTPGVHLTTTEVMKTTPSTVETLSQTFDLTSQPSMDEEATTAGTGSNSTSVNDLTTSPPSQTTAQLFAYKTENPEESSTAFESQTTTQPPPLTITPPSPIVTTQLPDTTTESDTLVEKTTLPPPSQTTPPPVPYTIESPEESSTVGGTQTTIPPPPLITTIPPIVTTKLPDVKTTLLPPIQTTPPPLPFTTEKTEKTSVPPVNGKITTSTPLVQSTLPTIFVTTEVPNVSTAGVLQTDLITSLSPLLETTTIPSLVTHQPEQSSTSVRTPAETTPSSVSTLLPDKTTEADILAEKTTLHVSQGTTSPLLVVSTTFKPGQQTDSSSYETTPSLPSTHPTSALESTTTESTTEQISTKSIGKTTSPISSSTPQADTVTAGQVTDYTTKLMLLTSMTNTSPPQTTQHLASSQPSVEAVDDQATTLLTPSTRVSTTAKSEDNFTVAQRKSTTGSTLDIVSTTSKSTIILTTEVATTNPQTESNSTPDMVSEGLAGEHPITSEDLNTNTTPLLIATTKSVTQASTTASTQGVTGQATTKMVSVFTYLSAWTECSVTCGDGGVKQRVRRCDSEVRSVRLTM